MSSHKIRAFGQGSARRLALWAALVSAIALSSAMPGVARTEDLNTPFPVDFGTSTRWYGEYTRTTITGAIQNNSGSAVHHLLLIVDELDGKGHVFSRTYRFVDSTIPAGGRASFEAEVRGAPPYRVYVDNFDVHHEKSWTPR